MSNSLSIQRLLAQAKQKEKKYNWLGAAKLHKKASDQLSKLKDFSKAADIQEQIGFCLFRAALQAHTHKDFRSKMKLALRAYERAVMLFEKIEGEGKSARVNYSKAMAVYAGFWLATDPSEKKGMLEDCWRLGKEALQDFEKAGDSLGYGRVCNDLLEICENYRFVLSVDWPELERIIEESLTLGEKAITALSRAGDDYELTRAYCWSSLVYAWAVIQRVLREKREKFVQESFSHSENALKLSEKVGDSYLVGISNWSAGLGNFVCAGPLDSTRRFLEKQKKQGTITKDNLLIGNAATWLSFITFLMTINLEEDPNKQREGYKKTIEYAEDALRHLRVIDYRPHIIYSFYSYTESYTRWAYIETDLEAKRVLLERAVKVGQKGLEHAERSGCPFYTWFVLHALSIALCWLSNTKTKVNEKKQLLEEALEKREKAIEIRQRVTPFMYFERGLSQNYRALIEAELAKIETEKGKKKKLLERAVSSMEKCLRFIERDVKEFPQLRKFESLGRFRYWFGQILNQLYLLTENKKVLERAIEVYNDSIETYGKVGQSSRMAESHWEIAKLLDRLGDHPKAASNYASAAEEYKVAAKKMPQLKGFSEDYSSYMQAWSEIEKGRYNHARERYDQSRQHYENAANLHKSSKLWSYLAPNYSAWAQLEKAEDLSRKDKTREAIQTFQQAQELFNKSKDSIQGEIKKIQSTDEKEMATDLVKASDIRCRYCQARIDLEEAKILGRKGEHDLSSKRYGSAAETIRKIIEETEFEPASKELEPLMRLCQAWQKMSLAEEKTSPELYLEASQLFGQAKERSLNKRTSLLALGNSNFCKALAAGIDYDTTLDITKHSTAKQHIERATTCYLKAGFQSAAEYAKATQRLFDAYTHMNSAEKETDPQKKGKYYRMAEKLLQTSANSYVKAKNPEKSDEVRRILKQVKEEKELATSLSEVLHAPQIVSTTACFTTPTPTHEKAVGLERFERASIQAHLSAPKDVAVEEDVEIQLDLVNVAKNFGLLVRTDNLLPKGFRVIESPPGYVMEDGSLDLGGKRFEPLKVETIKILARATGVGVFDLSPAVVYVDEAGQFHTYRHRPVRITVHPPHAFRFDAKDAQSTFDYLIKAFVKDYMRRRLPFEKSGWRSRMQIVKNAEISKSSVYGARGHEGRAMSELERRGLVETRVFPEERGRGGRIVKTRISYEKEPVKRYVDKQIIKKEKR